MIHVLFLIALVGVIALFVNEATLSKPSGVLYPLRTAASVLNVDVALLEEWIDQGVLDAWEEGGQWYVSASTLRELQDVLSVTT